MADYDQNDRNDLQKLNAGIPHSAFVRKNFLFHDSTLSVFAFFRRSMYFIVPPVLFSYNTCLYRKAVGQFFCTAASDVSYASSCLTRWISPKS